MTEIAQLFESALRQNRASLLRKAAMNTVARMPPGTTLRELLDSDAGEAIRELTLRDLKSALQEAGYRGRGPEQGARGVSSSASWTESREEKIFRQILSAMTDEPMTIGQLAKRTGLDVEELRGYLTWMKKAGKVTSSGRARATRYQVVR
jgi:predicted Rossmann fold nucleotide-binding protein DprA/Smf involved in DNA uptake